MQPAPLTETASPEEPPERIDRWLARRRPELSRSRLKALIGEGRVSRDGHALADPSEAVRPGATYRVLLPEPVAATPQAEAIPLVVVYEDAHLIVLDKPAGLVVHPAPGNETGTLVNALIAHCGDSLQGIGGELRPGIVHRLDKDTSGLMVAAKTEEAHRALSEAFATRDLDRAYLAFAWGLPAASSGEIDAPIGRDPAERKRMAIRTGGGRHALTRWRLLEAYGTGAVQLECRLATGRTHQIRVHLASIGHPLIGDPVYGRVTPARRLRLPEAARGAALAFPRQALHAFRLGFRHPVDGRAMVFDSPLPPDLAALRAALAAL